MKFLRIGQKTALCITSNLTPKKGELYDSFSLQLIEHFFTMSLGFQVDAKCQNVRFLKNRGGRNSGEAVVTFGSKKEVEAALERNRDYLGSRYVIINQN